MTRLIMVTLAAGLAGAGVPTTQAQPAPPATMTILSREGRRAVPVSVFNNQDYAAVDDLAAPFGLSYREVSGGLTVTVRGRTIIVTADQSVVSVNGRLVSLSVPPLKRDTRWWLPLEFLPRGLSLAVETRLDLRRQSRLLVVGDLRVPRVVARVEPGAASATVSLDITPVTATRVTSEAGRLQVIFDADALELSLPSLPAQGFVSALGQGEAPNAVLIATGPRYSAYRANTSQADASSSHLAIDLLASTTDVAAPSTPEVRPPLPMPIPATGVRTIVLDPGHGGEELGAQGQRGTQEKDVTLQVARRLRTLLESRLGVRVFLTRDDDRTVPLDDRSAFANNHKADIFLSIHGNAAVRPAMKGAEVYYLTVERADREARRRADDAATSLPALGGGNRTIDLILWETAQARYLEQSAALANTIQESLSAKVAMSPRAVQQAPFRVLVGANMPAALVEIGYLSNPEQEQQIASVEYQTAVAEALYDAVAKFRADLDRTQ
jgi:N-acetylmuramoyl-L-alanine amidase